MASSSAAPLPAENPIILDLGTTWGCALIGNSISFALFGLGSLQVYMYFWNYGDRDTGRLKTLVMALWLISAADSVLGFLNLWRLFVKTYGAVQKFQFLSTESGMQSVLESLMGFCVQLYFIQRMWRFDAGRRKILPALLVSLAIWPPIALIWTFVFSIGKPTPEFATVIPHSLLLSSMAVSAFVDACIAANMMLLLAPYRANLSTSRSIVHRLQLLSINSGLFTALVAVATLGAYAANPLSLEFFVPYIPMLNCYFCCFLTNLNARKFVRGEGGTLFVANMESARGASSDGGIFSPRDQTLRRTTPQEAGLELSSRKTRKSLMVNIDIERTQQVSPDHVDYDRAQAASEVSNGEKANPSEVDYVTEWETCAVSDARFASQAAHSLPSHERAVSFGVK